MEVYACITYVDVCMWYRRLFKKHNIQDTPAFKGACLQKVISAFRVEVNMYLAGVFCVRARVSRLYIWGVCRVAPLCICKVDADS